MKRKVINNVPSLNNLGMFNFLFINLGGQMLNNNIITQLIIEDGKTILSCV